MSGLERMSAKIEDFIDDYVIGRYADSFLKQLAEIEKGTLINASAFSGSLTNDDSIFVSWKTYPYDLGMVIFLVDKDLDTRFIYMSEHRICELGLKIS